MNTMFPNWKSYTDALTVHMSTECYAQSFPEYAKLIEENKLADLMIVKALLDAGYDAQDGFNNFINACFAGSRYIREFDYLPKMVDIFIARGAVVTSRMVDQCFDTIYIDASDYDFEDECNNIANRAVVLDLIGKYITTPLPGQTDWKNIKTMYMYDLIYSDIECSMKYAMYRKYCSTYLQSI